MGSAGSAKAIGTRSASSFMTPASHAAQDVLFVSAEPPRCSHVQLEPGAVLLEGFAAAEAPALLAAIEQVSQAAPLRQMMTARGWRMSVAMTNCGDAGWVSDRSGYRYDTIDPLTGRR